MDVKVKNRVRKESIMLKNRHITHINHVINSHFFVENSLQQHSCAHKSYRGRFVGLTTRVASAVSQQMSPGPSIQLFR